MEQSMALTRLPGNPEVPVTIRKSARARRLSLRVSRLDGRVTLTMPKRTPVAEGVRFLEEKADWVRGHLSQQPAVMRPQIGGTIPFEGAEILLLPGTRRSARLVEEGIEVPQDPERIGPSLKSLLRETARDRLVTACDRYSDAIGRPFSRMTLRDTRSRWGSCTADGALMFSFRLIMAPPEVLDYVAAHEVAHLVEMNHSSAFWNEVAALCPDYKTHRQWLRDHGELLHRVRFDG